MDVLPFLVPGNSEGPGKNVWMSLHSLFLETVKSWEECKNMLPFSVPGNSEGPGKNVWMCFLHSLFLETVKALAKNVWMSFHSLFLETIMAQEIMYGCASILCS